MPIDPILFEIEHVFFLQRVSENVVFRKVVLWYFLAIPLALWEVIWCPGWGGKVRLIRYLVIELYNWVSFRSPIILESQLMHICAVKMTTTKNSKAITELVFSVNGLFQNQPLLETNKPQFQHIPTKQTYKIDDTYIYLTLDAFPQTMTKTELFR